MNKITRAPPLYALLIAGALVAGATAGLAACSQEPSLARPAEAATREAPMGAALAHMPSPQSLQTEDFVAKMVGADIYEVKAAEIAAARARSPEVKAFAKEMAQGHDEARAKLEKAVLDSGEKLPMPEQPTDHQQSMLNMLGRGSPADFDRTYVDQQVQAHQDSLKELATYAGSGQAPAIKAVAAQLQPMIAAHLSKARALEDALNKN